MYSKSSLLIKNIVNTKKATVVAKRTFATTQKEVTVGIIPGDGIGKEVIPAAEEVLKQVSKEFKNAKLNLIHLDAGFETFQSKGNSLPKETLDALKYIKTEKIVDFERKCNGAMFGAVSSPTHKVQGYSSPILGMRKGLDLYANLRPVVSAPLESSRKDVDILIVRENTECLYVKRERLEDNGNTAIADRVITRRASTRIAEMAFKQAQLRAKARGNSSKKPLVTVVHKSNVLSVTDGLFREVCFEVAKKYPDVPVEEQIVDSMVYKLILEPQKYDVVVAPNLYGDILSDAAAALVGGLGLAPSANVGDTFALCEPVHGSAPDIAGKGIANPAATIRALALMLEHIEGLENGAQLSRKLQDAVNLALKNGPLPKDLGGNATTKQITEAILANYAKL